MATTAVDPTFIDTNVLVYANVVTAPLHQVALQALNDLWTAGTELWCSRQVFREYLATLSRPQTFAAPQPSAVLVAQIQKFQTLMRIAEDGPAVTATLLNLVTTVALAGKQVHDANIVATMQANGITRLLTHNTADFSRFSTMITVVPLVP
jgi:predicted nucleic acid-binding protein